MMNRLKSWGAKPISDFGRTKIMREDESWICLEACRPLSPGWGQKLLNYSAEQILRSNRIYGRTCIQYSNRFDCSDLVNHGHQSPMATNSISSNYERKNRLCRLSTYLLRKIPILERISTVFLSIHYCKIFKVDFFQNFMETWRISSEIWSNLKTHHTFGSKNGAILFR